MKHLGNVIGICGAEVEPVDVITFGSPCQDLSVAGKRAGIQDGERSNLFFEAVRIIKEMREATNGEYPKYAVWENVPGAFSSNKGHDFHAVLEALCSVCDSTVSIPKPYDAKRANQLVWSGAGEIVGSGYSVAWRTLDAQYWGVPQRRKRIYLVADFRGGRAAEILFKPESLRGDMQQGDETWQGAAADVVGGVDGSVGVEYCCSMITGQQLYAWEDMANPLKARDYKDPAIVAYSFDSLSSNGIDRVIPINDKATRFNGGGAERKNDGAGNGLGIGNENDPAATVTSGDRHAVCYDARNHNAQDISGTIQAKPNEGKSLNFINPVCFQNTGRGWWNESEVAATVRTACGGDSVKANLVAEKKRRYIIRRLTPTECARLQGFPDKWGHLAPYDPADAEFWEQVRKTHAEINGKKYKPVKNLKKWYEGLHTDSAEYKAYGNGLALPCAEFVIHGIAEHGAKTLGSLFDGIGGFPLAGVLNGITPLWASEVEPYPIAVTKSRFAASAAERGER